jgi:uncharacterized protein YfaS (alpha-2-macroglobulin family)
MPMTTRGSGLRRTIAAALAGSLVLTACWGDDDPAADDTTAVTTPAVGSGASPEVVAITPTATQQGDAVALRLSEGAPIRDRSPAVPVVAGDPLAPEAVAEILARLPAWAVPGDDARPFNRPADTLLPPQVGAIVDTPFPPPADAGPAPDPGDDELDVLRFQPEGTVEVAPFIAVTFDQPMVPIGTIDQLAAADVPVTVSPSIDGRWRWIGTRTLRFDADPTVVDRLPAATEYRVEVPRGTRSASGARLERSVSWTFTTPAPTVESFVGESDRLPLEPVFVAVFDQRVDPAAVLPTIDVTAGGGNVAIRLATAAEIAADDDARRAVADALDERTVAFRATGALPVDAAVTVTIGPGVPSAEGTRTSDAPVVYRARTYGRLDVARTECGFGAGCQPGAPFVVELTNELDLSAFDAGLITVTPAIPGLRVDVFGSTIQLQGATRGRTEYAVTLGGDLRDTFGQTLGDARTVRFDVGPAQPAIVGLPSDWITTDPFGTQPSVSIRTINHDDVRVRAWAVTPGDVAAYREYLERSWSDVDPAAPESWPLVIDEVVPIEAVDDGFVETAIDLSAGFAAAGTQLVVRIEPTEPYATDDELYWQNQPSVAWVQSTTLAVAAVYDLDEMLIWTTDLVTGEPAGNVVVELLGDGRVARTDAEGLVSVPLADEEITGVFANAGDRTAFLPFGWYGGVRSVPDVAEARWYVIDDRGVYRPGETAHLTGWVRRMAWDAEGAVERYPDGLQVDYRAYDAQGAEIGAGRTDVNTLGGFRFTVDVPPGANLGPAWVELSLVGLPADESASTGHSFQVQEFRRPEFEVDVRQESTDPLVASDPVTVAVEASYFAGGALGDADVDWLVSSSPTTYRPPNWDGYQFGREQPWWWSGGVARADVAGGMAADMAEPCFDCGPAGQGTEYEELSGRTDADGRHFLQVELAGDDIDLPRTVTTEATVFDVDRQAWAARTDLLVHPALAYVGLRSDRAFVEAGTPLPYDAVVVDVDGQPLPGLRVEVTAGRVEWGVTDGVWGEQVVDEQSCTFTSSADPGDGSMRCEFPTVIGGEHRITAIVTDELGRHNRSVATAWVAGEGSVPVRRVEQQALTLVPDHDTYAVGDTAEVLVQAPFDAVSGLLTVTRHGIVRSEPFELEAGSAVLDIAIDEAAVPGLTIQVDVVGVAERTADDGTPLPDRPPRPAFATGQLTLPVPPVTRTLDVAVAPAARQLQPGETTSVAVAVVGANGVPADGAEVAVIVVDEAVLALTDYRLTDPLDVFYGDVFPTISSRYTRSSVLLTRDDLLGGDGDGAAPDAAEEAATDDAGGAPAPADRAAGEAGGGEVDATIDVRSGFDPLAVYAAGLVTGSDGTVTVEVPLPDTLTRYRVMAVAVEGDTRFGSGESTITARLPLMIRPSAPRFLNFGDRAELPLVLQNQTDADLPVSVAIEVSNLALDSGGTSAGRLVTVPANGRVEVRFPVLADTVGTARARVAVVAGGESDAAEFAMPVYTPATAEAFATYGVIDEPGAAIAQPLVAPTGVVPQFGGLEINTSSTALQALTDAVIHLDDYPYRTADGYASRILAIASLRDVLEAFDAAELPGPTELDARVADDIAALIELQNDDGGWSWWARGLASVPWQTLHATHALAVAREAGYAVPSAPFEAALAHLRDIDEHIPADYTEDVRTTIRAYAVHVRTIAGERDTARATRLWREGGIALQLDAVAWLWPAIDDPAIRAEIDQLFANAAVETAGTVTFATSYSEAAYVIAASDRRTDAAILDALISEAPASDLVPKLVAGLLAGRRQGHWNSAQDDAFVLVALHHYFDQFESVTPEFIARAWLGGTYVAEQTFSGRTTDRATTVVPMNLVTSVADGAQIVLQKEGLGRLYYRLGLRYAPADLTLAPRDEGFVVERTYAAVDDPSDVRRDADGTWQIRAGAPVRVTVTMVADAQRTHVALVDPLPAGLEPVNPALAVSQTFAPDEPPGDDPLADDWCWCWQWFEHQNLRDDRAEAFTSFLSGGTYEYTYVARATTPGTFVVPPARAEQLFAPEVFGRSATARVVVT